MLPAVKYIWPNNTTCSIKHVRPLILTNCGDFSEYTTAFIRMHFSTWRYNLFLLVYHFTSYIVYLMQVDSPCEKMLKEWSNLMSAYPRTPPPPKVCALHDVGTSGRKSSKHHLRSLLFIKRINVKTFHQHVVTVIKNHRELFPDGAASRSRTVSNYSSRSCCYNQAMVFTGTTKEDSVRGK